MRLAGIWLTPIFLGALALLAPPPRSRAAAPRQRETERELAWASFMREKDDFDRYRLSDRDVIRVMGYGNPAAGFGRGRLRSRSDVPPDQVEIVLASGPNVTWWKGITAFKNAPPRRPGSRSENWVRLAQVETQDADHGPHTMRLDVGDLRDGLKLSFEKAKAFGAHTPMYSFDVPNAHALGGARITFTWERDG